MIIRDLPVLSEHEPVPETARFILRQDASGLSLLSVLTPAARPTRVDFLAPVLQHRLATSKRSEGLPKAIGLDRAGQHSLAVLDLTAGLAVDAYLLAAMGCHVTLLEKSPVLAALLADGLRRGRDGGNSRVAEQLDRLSLVHADAHDYLDRLPGGALPDVIYLDPMFPVRRKTARVKKDMALLQELLPPNDDIDILLAKAREKALRRVVLKRPGKGEKHPVQKPDFQVPGKACHFQVFLARD